MITLITGVPGTGKTLHVVKWLSELEQGKRPVFVHGIRDLVVPHEVAPDVMGWPDWAPDGALIVIDECQQFFRPRASSAAVPPAVAQLEVHRHRGLDFWLITQHPNLLDGNIRRLITRHVHFRRTWRGREQLEWSEVGNPDQPRSRELSARKKVALPKKAFDLYKSAEVHTKTPLAVPKYVYVFAIFLVLAVGAFFVVKRNIDPASHGASAESKTAAPVGQSAAGSNGGSRPSSGPAPMTVEEYAATTVPRMANMPQTAPRYDQLTQAKTAPRPAACVYTKTKPCRCYTQQATPFAIDPDLCKEIADKGYFVDWESDRGQVVKSDAPIVQGAPAAGQGGHDWNGQKRVL
ncbi:zonular occludens toxin domain-containing protein [Uliginosibacterium aquaticum]|uniref:Zona occludens toxin N-terminal domain-containing protein n=1 Tax=Uliginosibacterium aquaticum TaxID=2731212 RepID=A0ABX2IE54_9RHOO|nr:zonular occludens toxin domain-containing protein [Uliginosibacterium aquaticum]NSL54916.1 hypothetical protein [Uliginosibacterium aquaticum]